MMPPGWMTRGMQLADAIAKQDPEFAARLREAKAKSRERFRSVRGLERPHPSQVAAMRIYTDVVVGRDIRRKG